MRKTITNVAALLIIAGVFSASVTTRAQRTRTQTTGGTASSLLASLPDSDAVASVKMKRALNEAMPRLFQNNPAKLDAANAQIQQFKERTGIDPRAFDEIAFGFHYTYPREGITKLESIGLARGTFNPAAIVAAGKTAAEGKYREEKLQGRTIYIFGLDQDIKLLGLISFRVREFAASPLDANTMALGDPDSVRNFIQGGRNQKRASAELIALATRDPNAIAGFCGNITPALLENLDIGNRAIAQNISAVRQVYGSAGLNQTDVEMFFAARTVDPESAKNLGDTIEGLKQLGSMFVTRLSAAKSALAKNALNNLKITTQANELQIRTAVAQASIGPVVGF